jgi:DNA-3-methyladenine glycosylase
MDISINDKAPDFTLPDQNGESVSLKSFRGKYVVLYFYPRADTPGCTIEACSFRDSYKKVENAGAVVLGVSPDEPKALKKFEDKFGLPFTLLGDADKKVCNAYGVIQEKKYVWQEGHGRGAHHVHHRPGWQGQAHLPQSEAGRPRRPSAGLVERSRQGRSVDSAAEMATSPIPSERLSAALPREFYDRDPRRVCRELLGKVLVRNGPRKYLAARIVEVEAYLGKGDGAAHSFRGRTERNAVLFGPPGFAYVYFIYGNHYCLNVSCLPDGVAGGILFRAAEPLAGIEAMARARGLELTSKRDLRNLTSGPGRMAEAFGITRDRDNGKDLASAKSDLFIADDGYGVKKVLATPRIGITKATERPWRYVIPGNPFVSGPKNLRS